MCAFYQILLSKGTTKYCGVATLFCGIRVYTRSAMGMPGSETAVEIVLLRPGQLHPEGMYSKAC